MLCVRDRTRSSARVTKIRRGEHLTLAKIEHEDKEIYLHHGYVSPEENGMTAVLFLLLVATIETKAGFEQ